MRIQSCCLLVSHVVVGGDDVRDIEGGGGITYQLVDIPAAVLAALLSVGHTLVDAKVPVHVGCLLAAAVLGRLEAAAALRAGRAEVFVQLGGKMRPEAWGMVSRVVIKVRDMGGGVYSRL